MSVDSIFKSTHSKCMIPSRLFPLISQSDLEKSLTSPNIYYNIQVSSKSRIKAHVSNSNSLLCKVFHDACYQSYASLLTSTSIFPKCDPKSIQSTRIPIKKIRAQESPVLGFTYPTPENSALKHSPHWLNSVPSHPRNKPSHSPSGKPTSSLNPQVASYQAPATRPSVSLDRATQQSSPPSSQARRTGHPQKYPPRRRVDNNNTTIHLYRPMDCTSSTTPGTSRLFKIQLPLGSSCRIPTLHNPCCNSRRIKTPVHRRTKESRNNTARYRARRPGGGAASSRARARVSCGWLVSGGSPATTGYLARRGPPLAAALEPPHYCY